MEEGLCVTYDRLILGKKDPCPGTVHLIYVYEVLHMAPGGNRWCENTPGGACRTRWHPSGV